MKKYDLFELAIFGIGVWAAYQFIAKAFVTFAYVVQLALDGFRIENTQRSLVHNIILSIGFYLVAHFALRKTNDVMRYLKPGFSKEEAELGEEPVADTDRQPVLKTEIMRMIIIGLGIILTVPQVPEFFQYAYLSFQSKLNPYENDFDTSYLIFSVIKLLAPALLIIFSKRFTALLKI
jgi:hypothetical protein